MCREIYRLDQWRSKMHAESQTLSWSYRWWNVQRNLSDSVIYLVSHRHGLTSNARDLNCFRLSGLRNAKSKRRVDGSDMMQVNTYKLWRTQI